MVDLRKIKKLIELVEQSGIAELEVHKGDESVRIARPAGGSPATMASNPTAARVTVDAGNLGTARAPMAGTFYAAPEPGADRFVVPGDAVALGDTLCIIESMKMMNEIPSEVEGIVIDVLVADGEPVAKGQGLIQIDRS